MSHPAALAVPAQLADARLRTLLDDYRREWQSVDPLLPEVIDHLEALVLAGGKRVRPAMAYWGFIGGGGDPTDGSIQDLGAALELLQAFALFHDDVMDGSPTRRGQPTAHVREIARHETGQWRGDARRYGESVAILAGDVALVMSDVLLDSVNADVRRFWNLLRLEVNLGQFLDVVGTARGDVPLATAERIVEYKTARYTIVRPLQMGAALAGRPDLAPSLAMVGTPLGVAFQLRDDLLGALGDTAVTGKPVGDDLREGKPTPLLATARDLATDSQAEVIATIGSELDDADVERLQQVLHDTGAVAAVESQIGALTSSALQGLASIELLGDATQRLSELAVFLAGREG